MKKMRCLKYSAFLQNTAVHMVFLVAIVISGCATLPPRPPVPDVYALPPASSGTLSRVSSEFTENAAPGQSGFLLLSRNDDALKWRLALIDNAVSSIDAQYFIWSDDEAANLLFDRLLSAADRGVRVRILVDDILLAGNDRDITAITMHPNFDIKIFNPVKTRKSYLGALSEFLFNLKELNRRMHNKLFVVDNRLAIVGGRNIGSPYFGLSRKYNFRDLDVLVTGAVVEDLSNAFDIYWNAEMAYPGSAMSKKANRKDLQDLRERVDEYLRANSNVLASYRIDPSEWKDKMLSLPAQMETGEARFLQDVPVNLGEEDLRLPDMLDYLAKPSREELIIVTPYLIPMGTFLEDLAELSKEGVKIKVLTGSMGANNHTAAHSHYKKYRRRILSAGAELYEFRHDPSPAVRDVTDVPPVQPRFISLHVKALVGDRKRCFVGSLNLDPRALVINTENGLYIESARFCTELAEQFDTLMLPENAWHVYMNENKHLRWESGLGDVAFQPARSFRQRIADFFYRLLPIEGQL